MKKVLIISLLYFLSTYQVFGQVEKRDWVITNDTIFGKINWDTREMLSITQEKDSLIVLIEIKDIYLYQINGSIKYGNAKKPVVKEKLVILNDTTISQKLKMLELQVWKNKNQINMTKQTLTEFYLERKRAE